MAPVAVRSADGSGGSAPRWRRRREFWRRGRTVRAAAEAAAPRSSGYGRRWRLRRGTVESSSFSFRDLLLYGGTGGSAGGDAGTLGGAGGLVITVYATSSPTRPATTMRKCSRLKSRHHGGRHRRGGCGRARLDEARRGGRQCAARGYHRDRIRGSCSATRQAVGSRPVALSGRVPAKVNLEGGPISDRRPHRALLGTRCRQEGRALRRHRRHRARIFSPEARTPHHRAA